MRRELSDLRQSGQMRFFFFRSLDAIKSLTHLGGKGKMCEPWLEIENGIKDIGIQGQRHCKTSITQTNRGLNLPSYSLFWVVQIQVFLSLWLGYVHRYLIIHRNDWMLCPIRQILLEWGEKCLQMCAVDGWSNMKIWAVINWKSVTKTQWL